MNVRPANNRVAGRESQGGYLIMTIVVTLFLLATVAMLLTQESAVGANAARTAAEPARAAYAARAGLQRALWMAENNACMGGVSIPTTPLGDDSYAAAVTGAAAGSAYVLDADQDAWIRSDDVDRNNDSANNHVRFEGGKTEQVLTRFDLSALPDNAQINSAIAWFHVESGKAHPEGAITVHEITADWSEADVTWASFDGAYRPGPIGVIPAQATGGAWVSLNLTGLVQAWVNGQQNLGILFTSTAEGLHAEYSSRESGSHPPRLEVTVGSGPASPVTVQATGTLDSGVTRSLVRAPVPAYQPPTGFQVTPDQGAGRDGMIREEAFGNNLGANENLGVRDTAGGNRHHALLQFDLSGIPVGARIAEATLSLHQHDAGTPGGTVSVHRLMKDWDEGDEVDGAGDGATWVSYDFFRFWSAPGGDYALESSALTTIPGGGVGRYEWDVTRLVNDWVAGAVPNFGLILTPGAPGTDVRFYSSDFADAALHPRLTVRYACACGSPCLAPRGAGRIALIGDGGSPGADDQLKMRLFESWGYEVTFFEDRDSDTINWSDFDVAYVSGTAVASDVRANLRSVSIGIVNEAPGLYDDLELAGAASERVGASVSIVDNSHFITSVFTPGPLSIYTGDMEILTADAPLADDLQILGEFGGAATLSVLEAGARTTGGTAAGRRVTVPFGRHAAAGFDWANLDANGYLLAQRAIAWAARADAVADGDLLMVVRNGGSLTVQEAARKSLFESWGYVVSVIDDGDSQSDYDAALAGNDVVYVGEDASSNDVGSKLNDATIGVVVEEAGLVVPLGLAPAIDWSSGTGFDIQKSHYITETLGVGPVTILTSSEQLADLTVGYAPEFDILGRNSEGPVLAALEAGGALYGGGEAPGRRVFLPWGGDGMDIGNLNADGLTIFRRAIDWAAGAGPDHGPVAHWRLDEGTGLDAVDSVGGHDGTLTNGPVWSAGAIGTGVEFNDPTHALVVPHDDNLTITDRLTIAAWVSAPELAPNRAIVQKGTSNTDVNYYLGMNDAKLVFAVSPEAGGWNDVSSDDTPIQLDTWHHVAVTFDNAADTVRFYFDGQPFGERTQAVDPAPRIDSLRIGRNHTTYGWRGKLDEVRIYRDVLDDGAIAALAERPPVAHWKLDDGSGNTAVDSIGGFDGALMNGPAWTAGRVDGGLEFDGNDDYVDLGTDTAFTDIFEGGATVTGWIFPRSWGESDNGRILDKSSETSGNRDGWMIALRGETPALQFAQGFTSTRGFWRSQEGTVALNQWTHFALAYDASSVANDPEIYLNGVRQSPLVEIAPVGSVATDAGIALRMGNFAQATSRTFDGIVDDVRIYDRLLDPSEIAALAAPGAGGGGSGGGCSGTYRDAFNAESWSGSDGSLSWTGPWAEVGESNGPSSGDIRIMSDLGDNRLRIRDNDNGGEGVERVVDLSGAATATLSFDYRRQALDSSGDYVAVFVSSNGTSGPWTELPEARIAGPDNDGSYQPLEVDISASISATTAIRLLSAPNMGGTDTVYFDNVTIQCAP